MENPAVTCHEQYYQQYLPRLYLAAVYLLGDQAMAETVTEQVWLDACVKGARDGESAFSRRGLRTLLRCCAGVHCKYRPEEISKAVSSPDLLPRLLESQRFGVRCLAVLRLVLSKDLSETASILRQPRWLVSRRVKRLSEEFSRMTDEPQQRSFC